MDFDLVVRGGEILDGTGAKAYRADLGVCDGMIVAIGEIPTKGKREIDAKGCVVAPGFIDIHTHYDAQVFWDRMLSISPWHGVTTVLIGNCGFGVAPTRPEHRDLILRTLENVEGMSLDCLREGLGEQWPFVAFGEYLDAIESRGTAIHVGTLVGHTPVRTFVMGEAAVEREATPEEVAEMRALVEAALDAGALGFATSRAPTHIGYGGNPVPSRISSTAEVRALAGALRGRPQALLQVTIGADLWIDKLAEIQREIERPVTWTALLGGMLGPTGHRKVLKDCAALQAEGVRVYPQVSGRPLMLEFQFSSPFPMAMLPAMKPVFAADDAGRRQLYADPAFRVQLRHEVDTTFGLFSFRQMWVSHAPGHADLVERKVPELAVEQGRHAVDIVLDLALATNLEARFRMAVLNTDEDIVAELLRDPSTVLGLSDAGAHASQLCDAGASTHLLGHWVREKGVLTLEEAVRRLTSEPAALLGLMDRGRLAPGMFADLVVFDPATVACGPLRRVADLPGGADRLVADALGVRAVVVEGVPVRLDGRDAVDPAGPLPGRLLRAVRAA